MKQFCYLIYFCLLSFFTSAQSVSTTAFQRDFLAIVQDAQKGFPQSTGDVTEDIGWYGTTYSSRLAFFADQAAAMLQYVKAQDNKYSAPTPERFYFAQSFQITTAAGKWMVDSAEKVLDEIAASAKLTKTEVKQSKQDRKLFKRIEYRSGSKAVYSFSIHLPSKTTSISITSPYRPGNVPAPLNLLGTMAFYSSGTSFMYLVPVYGNTIPDKQKLAKDVGIYADKNTSYNTWEWFPGRSVRDLEKTYGKTMYIKEMSGYTVQ